MQALIWGQEERKCKGVATDRTIDRLLVGGEKSEEKHDSESSRLGNASDFQSNKLSRQWGNLGDMESVFAALREKCPFRSPCFHHIHGHGEAVYKEEGADEGVILEENVGTGLT